MSDEVRVKVVDGAMRVKVLDGVGGCTIPLAIIAAALILHGAITSLKFAVRDNGAECPPAVYEPLPPTAEVVP